MQTFLPYNSFIRSAACLDDQRLGKQRSETLGILTSIRNNWTEEERLHPYDPSHDLYKTGDSDAPESILDSNGEVVLDLCRRCNRGEQELLDKPMCSRGGYANHPVVKMWVGYEDALVDYGMTMCLEWIRRGFHDNGTVAKFQRLAESPLQDQVIYPVWFGDAHLHTCYQSVLLQKKPDHYVRWFPDVPNDLTLVYPTQLSAIRFDTDDMLTGEDVDNEHF